MFLSFIRVNILIKVCITFLQISSIIFTLTIILKPCEQFILSLILKNKGLKTNVSIKWSTAQIYRDNAEHIMLQTASSTSDGTRCQPALLYVLLESHSANTFRCAFHTRKGKGGTRSSESIKKADFSLSLSRTLHARADGKTGGIGLSAPCSQVHDESRNL